MCNQTPLPFKSDYRFERHSGVHVGEIGPKLGLNTNDNGYLGFTDYRIPRDQMMMKHAQVLEASPPRWSSRFSLIRLEQFEINLS